MRNRPLQWQLSMLIVVVLGLSLTVATWIGYRQLEQALVSASTARLKRVTREFAGLFAQMGARINEEVTRASTSPLVVRFLQDRDLTSGLAVREAVERERVRTNQTVSLRLTDREGRDVLVVGGDTMSRTEARSLSTGLSPLHRSENGLTYSVTRAIADTANNLLGYAIIERRVAARQTVEQLSTLIGSDAELLMGNARGDEWFNLTTEKPSEVIPLSDELQVLREQTSNEPFLTASVAVDGTPWAVAVQFPRRTALAPARTFLQQTSIAALIVLALGTAIAFLVVRKVMRPLREVGLAASDLARGDYSRRVHITSRNDVGQLASTFNGMAQQVEQTRSDLQEHATALQETNLELRQSELRYRRFVEESPDAMVVHRGSRVLFANPAAAQLLGAHSMSDLIGQSISNLADGASDAPQPTSTSISGEHRSLRAPLSERQLARLDGTTVYVDAASSPFTLDAKPSTLTILRDVSNRKDLEARYLQAQKMEVLGQLAGGVAHDFNNLLTIIGSYSALLLADTPPEDPRRQDLEEIINATSRAAALTRQLLAVSRKQVLQPDVLDINDVVGGVAKLLGRTIPSHISLRLKPRALSGNIFADPVQIEQILMNLAVNAIDAMPSGGVLTIETDTVQLSEFDLAMNDVDKPGTYVTVAVSDTGTGIDTDVRERIFEPFFTTKAPGKGTGLGLATVKAIIEQLHGQITVYGEAGMGTVFRLYIPLHGAASTPLQRRDEDRSWGRGGNETVLVAEDEGPVRNAVRRMLERAGYSVLEAGNGAEALQIFNTSKGVDVLLTDMMMPDMSGSQLAQQIREMAPNIPVLFMSGYTSHSTFLQGFESARATFIQKPFTGTALLERIREVLES